MRTSLSLMTTAVAVKVCWTVTGWLTISSALLASTSGNFSSMASLCSLMAHSVIYVQFGNLYGVLCRHLLTRKICQASLPISFDFFFHVSSVVRTVLTYLVEVINSTASDWYACVIKHVNIPFYYKHIIYLHQNLYSLWFFIVLLSMTQSTNCHK